MVRKDNGTLNFLSADEQTTLIKAIYVYSEFVIDDKLFTINEELQQDVKDGHLAEGFTICNKNSACLTNIKLCCDPNLPSVRFRVASNFLLNLKIVRHAIIFDFDISLHAIIRKNRQIRKENFPKRAWLDKQGAIFGSGSNSTFIYHTPGISSLETIPSKKRLIVNLDYHKDHPQVMNNPNGGYLDRSHSCFSSGDETSYCFSMVLGYQPPVFLRLMSAPKGFLATHVWTEHACHSDLRVHRALYYGSELIQKPGLAEGGFVKYGIPVTKSVFYKNELGIRSEDPAMVFHNPMVAIKESPDFLSFLKDLQSLGFYDICLHCLQPQTSTPKEYEEALEYMEKNFDSACWIDHLWYRWDGTRGCCEAITCEGLDPASPYYMEPLWLRYGVKYFWSYSAELLRRVADIWADQRTLKFKSAVFEMVKARKYIKAFSYTAYKVKEKITLKGRTIKPKRFVKSAERPLNIWDASDADPNPIYWARQSPREHSSAKPGPRIYSWATRAAYFPAAEKPDPYSENGVERLIRSWGLSISHAYPVSLYLGDRNSAWQINRHGKVVISPFFDSLLKSMSELQKGNKLYLATIRNIMDYWIKLEKVEIQYIPLENAARIYNYNSETVEGIAIVCQGAEIFVNGQRPQFKRLGEEIVFWFDIDALTYTTISSQRELSKGQGEIPPYTTVDKAIIE
jgi:hypothetical protein